MPFSNDYLLPAVDSCCVISRFTMLYFLVLFSVLTYSACATNPITPSECADELDCGLNGNCCNTVAYDI